MGAFSNDNRIEAIRFNRQQGKCAVCGKQLVWSNYEVGKRGSWDAHHIDGDPQNNVLSNCACVCSSCHFYECHSEDWKNGALLPRSSFILNR